MRWNATAGPEVRSRHGLRLHGLVWHGLVRHVLVWLVVAMLGMLGGAGSSIAQSGYPDRPIRIIVTFPPGGGVDVVARMVAPALQQSMGQPVIVENRPGAAGNVGMAQAARAEPDGYTLMMTSSPYLVNPALYKSPPYDPFTDFAPISELASAPDVLVVHPATGITRLDELVTQARAAPDTFNFATAGIGTMPHLMVERLKLMAKISMQHIPYPGAGPAMPAVMSGATQVGAFFLPPVTRHIKAKAMTALAVGSAQRFRDLPDVPTLREAGFDFESETLILAFAPGKTPRAIVDRLHKEFAAALASPAVRERADQMGFTVVAGTPDALAARIARDVPAFRKLIADTGIPQQ